MRRAARIDANHTAIVAALERAGASVTSLAGVGEGVADLLVSHRGRWTLIEVKDGTKPPSERKLTPAQQRWHSLQHAPVYIVTSPEAALRAIGVLGASDEYMAREHTG